MELDEVALIIAQIPKKLGK